MITVQQVFQKFYPEYLKSNYVSSQQAKAASDIMLCRTPIMGGHQYECDECGYDFFHYNSCRNRHCNLCQNLKRTIWADKQADYVLDAPYFHLVFTIPKELHPLVYQNQKVLYTLMYKAVSETLNKLAASSKYLGAQIGFFSLLHTWSQDLFYHPHIHTVVMAGGLTKDEKWKTTRKKFFIPVKVLAKKFRGIFLAYLEQYYEQKLLILHGNITQLKDTDSFQKLLTSCYAMNWYAYTKKTFSGPMAVVRYLGRYTHRVAIANERIVSMDNEYITISVRDRDDGNKEKLVTIKGYEFIRRFLFHILPKKFVKIRYFGILSNRNKKTKLTLCRKLSNSKVYTAQFEGLNTRELIQKLFGKDIGVCPCCLFGMLKLKTLLQKGGYS